MIITDLDEIIKQKQNSNETYWGFKSLEDFIKGLDSVPSDYFFHYKDKLYWIIYDDGIHMYGENPNAEKGDPDYYDTVADVRYDTDTVRTVVENHIMHDGVSFKEALATPGAIWSLL